MLLPAGFQLWPRKQNGHNVFAKKNNNNLYCIAGLNLDALQHNSMCIRYIISLLNLKLQRNTWYTCMYEHMIWTLLWCNEYYKPQYMSSLGTPEIKLICCFLSEFWCLSRKLGTTTKSAWLSVTPFLFMINWEPLAWTHLAAKGTVGGYILQTNDRDYAFVVDEVL